MTAVTERPRAAPTEPTSAGELRRIPLAELHESRFWQRCDRSGGPRACWIWTGARSTAGYGQLRVHGHGLFYAHHIALQLAGRPLPAGGLVCDHLCRNRACVNPEHIELVTSRENTLRGESIPALRARQTLCARGHSLDDSNTIRMRRGRGRECRACRVEREANRPHRDRRVYDRAYRARRKDGDR